MGPATPLLAAPVMIETTIYTNDRCKGGNAEEFIIHVSLQCTKTIELHHLPSPDEAAVSALPVVNNKLPLVPELAVSAV